MMEKANHRHPDGREHHDDEHHRRNTWSSGDADPDDDEVAILILNFMLCMNLCILNFSHEFTCAAAASSGTRSSESWRGAAYRTTV